MLFVYNLFTNWLYLFQSSFLGKPHTVWNVISSSHSSAGTWKPSLPLVGLSPLSLRCPSRQNCVPWKDSSLLRIEKTYSDLNLENMEAVVQLVCISKPRIPLWKAHVRRRIVVMQHPVDGWPCTFQGLLGRIRHWQFVLQVQTIYWWWCAFTHIWNPCRDSHATKPAFTAHLLLLELLNCATDILEPALHNVARKSPENFPF